MTKVTAALFKEQGVTVAVISVKSSACLNEAEQRKTLNGVSGFFPEANTVIVWEKPNGQQQFYGRPDIVKFLCNIHPARLPWKEYTFS